MNASPPSSPCLPPGDRKLLHLAGRLVPAAQRAEWIRSWVAELWFCHHAPRGAGSRSLRCGVVCDALWLRSEQIHQAVSGTPLLCLVSLLCAIGVAALPALCRTGRWCGLGAWLVQQDLRFLLESSLIFAVSYATASAEVAQAAGGKRVWLRARLFQATKVVLVLTLAFVLTADLSFPIRLALPLTAEFLQSMSFALFALLALRWSLGDDLARCKHCLCLLDAPERVGRPSHNFLEWNGTELLCRRGHGLLSVPEIETSWCRTSAWVPRQPFAP